MDKLKIVTLNTANSLLNDEQDAFLHEGMFDVICLQEISPAKFNQYKSDLEMYGYYYGTYVNDGEQIGIGILSKYKFVDTKILHFGEHEKNIESHEESHRALLVATIDPGNSGDVWNIANIHFTWSPNGLPSEQQKAHVRKLIETLDEYESLILCGDFNAPRGGEIFSHIASKYVDNVPDEYTTSIDSKNHRAGELNYMIDGIFSTIDFKSTDFATHANLSDHLALVATFSKKEI